MSPNHYHPNLFAERLETLFKLRGLKAEYVAMKIGISETYLSRLRHGKATNPGYALVQALSAVFGVNPGYFFGEGEKDSPILDDIALRAGDLDDNGRKALRGMLEYIANLHEKNPNKKTGEDSS